MHALFGEALLCCAAGFQAIAVRALPCSICIPCSNPTVCTPARSSLHTHSQPSKGQTCKALGE